MAPRRKSTQSFGSDQWTDTEIDPLRIPSQPIYSTFGGASNFVGIRKPFDAVKPKTFSVPRRQNNAFVTKIRPQWLCYAVVVASGVYMIAISGATPFLFPSWDWDYNYYDGRKGNSASDAVGSHPNLLLAQISGNVALEPLSAISGLPNRAYAHQWGHDFVLYDSGTSARKKSCFQKVTVLDYVKAKKNHNARYNYDRVAVFPADTIIIDLDFDLNQLLPRKKLVAIAGWEPGISLFQSRTGLLFFNFEHRLADTVLELWKEEVEPNDMTCGASNDLQIVVEIIRNVIGRGESLEDYIEPLEEGNKGYVGKALKSIYSKVPSSKFEFLLANKEAFRVQLQKTADSVCYRFYPKCLVIN